VLLLHWGTLIITGFCCYRQVIRAIIILSWFAISSWKVPLKRQSLSYLKRTFRKIFYFLANAYLETGVCCCCYSYCEIRTVLAYTSSVAGKSVSRSFTESLNLKFTVKRGRFWCQILHFRLSDVHPCVTRNHPCREIFWVLHF
jgi:hypothetical protein